jgi:tRNA-specific 2-thiouridylase
MKRAAILENLAKKAIVMYSGGADSTLTIRLMQDQGIECIAVNVQIPFYGDGDGGCAGIIAEDELDSSTPLLRITLGDEYLKMLVAPKYGFGRAMNPCRDCHIMMLRAGKKLMKEYGASFVATGEVIGQRPNSQKYFHLGEVERDSGLLGRLLRPLSAKLLTPTIPEMQGIVDRSKLYDIQGRTRVRQHEVAASIGVKLPGSGGGCALTEEAFSRKVADLYKHCQGEHPQQTDTTILKIGRHMRWSPDYKMVIAKDEHDSLKLEKALQPGDIFFNSDAGLKGPMAIIRGNVPESDYPRIASLLMRYCGVPTTSESMVTYSIDGVEAQVAARPMPLDEVARYHI